jgi:hydrogenase-1 operon protein HyaF
MHDAGPFENVRTGLARAVQREILQYLQALASDGTETAVDLRSLPMSAADRSELEEVLGRGEVSATLSAMGDSEVWETNFPGVWWVRHRGNDGRVIAEHVEVTLLPEILKSDLTDVRAAAVRLSEHVNSGMQAGTDLEE